jgi:type I restriction enzyme S subunit
MFATNIRIMGSVEPEICEQIEQLTSEANKTIEILQERRSALISAAVTGKIDVRGWQPSASAAPALAIAHG